MKLMENTVKRSKVAVIGLGLTGVSTLKNLLEEGFDAVGFDKNPYIGGLWQWCSDPNQTSVLKHTQTNISKQSSCYQDFPFPDEAPNYPSGDEVAKYIRDYANHFNLNDRCKLGVQIERVELSPERSQWLLRLKDQQAVSRTEYFDRVVVTTGPFSKRFTPRYEGDESFRGKILHSQDFKDADAFKGKRVIVAGLSNTGGDVAVELAETAEKVYVSHRSGVYVISRLSKGKPLDHRASRRIASIVLAFNSRFPELAGKIGGYFLGRQMLRANPFIKPSWGLLPAKSPQRTPPVANEYILKLLAEEKVTSLPGIKRFIPDSASIEFVDGTIVDSVDAVIFSTGYFFDYSILSPEVDPTNFPAAEWDSSPHVNGLKYPRLYQGIFSTKHPDSLAFIGPFRGHSAAAFSNGDLSSQAIAQIWKGNFNLPSHDEMEAWCDENYATSLAQLSKWRLMKVGANPRKLERWLNDAAGNGMNEMLDWKHWKAWKFWFNDWKLYRLVMDGINSPFVYRLFDGRQPNGRKKWDGAREAIFKVNGVTVKKSS